MRRELSDVWIRALKPPASGRLEVWDSKVTGLCLRLTPSDVATWSARARTADGKQARPSLGRWPDVGISEARRLARAVIAKIEAGGDPVAEDRAKVTERLARIAQPTVAERLSEWRDAKTDGWSVNYRDGVERFCRLEIIPHLGNEPLAEVTREDWTRLIARKRRQSASSGANLYRTISSFLGFAEVAGWPTSLLPRKGARILAPAVASRERTLTDDELAAVWRAADGMAPKVRAFIHLVMATAARREECANIATVEVDLDGATWRIPADRTKNHTSYIVPLPASVVAELSAIWPPHGDVAGPGWKLLGSVPGSGLSGYSKIKARLDERCGVRDWVLHDLRRTARSTMARLGVIETVGELALNHLSGRSALVRTYDRHDYRSEIIAALRRWQSHIESLVSGKPTASVIALRATA